MKLRSIVAFDKEETKKERKKCWQFESYKQQEPKEQIKTYVLCFTLNGEVYIQKKNEGPNFLFNI